MAYKNKSIFNSKTGMGLKFLQTSKDTKGLLLEMEATYQPQSSEPPPHYHPNQEEYFTIISGEMNLRMNGQLTTLKSGDILYVPKNKVHSMWNSTSENAIVNWKVMPALGSEYFFETFTGLANDGKTNQNGIPNILQLALLVNRFSKEIRLAKPPYWVQQIVFGILTPFSLLFGYKRDYKKFVD